MNEWVNIHKSSLMKDSNNSFGLTEHGLEHYFQIIINQNDALVEQLVNICNKLKKLIDE